MQGKVNQNLIAVGAKLLRYDNKKGQFSRNCLFEQDQKRLFEENDWNGLKQQEYLSITVENILQ